MRWLVVAAVVLASCASGKPSATDTTQGATGAATAASTAAAPTVAAPASAAATAGAAASAQAASPKPSGAAFADLIRSGKAATYKVTYKWTTTFGGNADTSTQTWSFKPPKARLDFSSTDPNGTKATVSFFEIEGGSYMCSTGSGESFCLKTDDGTVGGLNAAFGLQESFEKDPNVVTGATLSTRTIAGQQGQCYTVGGLQTLGLASGTFCYTSTGVPLLLEWKAGNDSWAMEATSFSSSVPDGDFVLPAKPIN